MQALEWDLTVGIVRYAKVVLVGAQDVVRASSDTRTHPGLGEEAVDPLTVGYNGAGNTGRLGMNAAIGVV